jgi:hypothetical protein
MCGPAVDQGFGHFYAYMLLGLAKQIDWPYYTGK